MGDAPVAIVGWVAAERGAIGELLRMIADETDATEKEWDVVTGEAGD